MTHQKKQPLAKEVNLKGQAMYTMRQKWWVVEIVVKSNLNVVVPFDVGCFYVIILESYLCFKIF